MNVPATTLLQVAVMRKTAALPRIPAGRFNPTMGQIGSGLRRTGGAIKNNAGYLLPWAGGAVGFGSGQALGMDPYVSTLMGFGGAAGLDRAARRAWAQTDTAPVTRRFDAEIGRIRDGGAPGRFDWEFTNPRNDGFEQRSLDLSGVDAPDAISRLTAAREGVADVGRRHSADAFGGMLTRNLLYGGTALATGIGMKAYGSAQNLERATGAAADATEQARDAIGGLTETAQRGLDQADRTFSEIGNTAQNIRESSTRVRDVTDQMSETSQNVTALSENLNSTLDSLQINLDRLGSSAESMTEAQAIMTEFLTGDEGSALFSAAARDLGSGLSQGVSDAGQAVGDSMSRAATIAGGVVGGIAVLGLGYLAWKAMRQDGKKDKKDEKDEKPEGEDRTIQMPQQAA